MQAQNQKQNKKREHPFDFSFNKEKEYLVQSLYLQINAGVPILEALETIKSETDSPTLKDTLAEMMFDLETGSTLSACFEKSKVGLQHILAVKIFNHFGGFICGINQFYQI